MAVRFAERLERLFAPVLRRIPYLYDSEVGFNPVIVADWRVFRHDFRKKRLHYFLLTMIMYLVFPTSVSAFVVYQNYLAAGYTQMPPEYLTSCLNMLTYAVAAIALLHYFSIVLLSLVSPLGNGTQNLIYSDPPIAQSISRRVFWGRLLPRIAVIPFFAIAIFMYEYGTAAWRLDTGYANIFQLNVLVSISALLAGFQLLSYSVLAHMYIPFPWARAILVCTMLTAFAVTTNISGASTESYSLLDALRILNPFSSAAAISASFLRSQPFLSPGTAPSALYPMYKVALAFAGQTIINVFLWRANYGSFIARFGRCRVE